MVEEWDFDSAGREKEVKEQLCLNIDISCILVLWSCIMLEENEKWMEAKSTPTYRLQSAWSIIVDSHLLWIVIFEPFCYSLSIPVQWLSIKLLHNNTQWCDCVISPVEKVNCYSHQRWSVYCAQTAASHAQFILFTGKKSFSSLPLQNPWMVCSQCTCFSWLLRRPDSHMGLTTMQCYSFWCWRDSKQQGCDCCLYCQ